MEWIPFLLFSSLPLYLSLIKGKERIRYESKLDERKVMNREEMEATVGDQRIYVTKATRGQWMWGIMIVQWGGCERKRNEGGRHARQGEAGQGEKKRSGASWGKTTDVLGCWQGRDGVDGARLDKECAKPFCCRVR